MIKEALYYQRGNSGEEAEKELLILEKRELSEKEIEEFVKKWGGAILPFFATDFLSPSSIRRAADSPVTEGALQEQSFSLWRKMKGNFGIM